MAAAMLTNWPKFKSLNLSGGWLQVARTKAAWMRPSDFRPRIMACSMTYLSASWNSDFQRLGLKLLEAVASIARKKRRTMPLQGAPGERNWGQNQGVPREGLGAELDTQLFG